jgi:hypothetical protein
MRNTIRTEFDKEHAPHYLMASAPVAMLLSLPLPPIFTPLIMAAFGFLPLFYYVRRERFDSAFIMVILWMLLNGAVITGMTILFPAFMVDKIVSAAIPLTIHTDQNDPMGWVALVAPRSGGMAVDAVLATISGGALYLVSLANRVNAIAYDAGVAFGAGGISAAALAFSPWTVIRIAGHTMLALPLSHLFYVRLEKGTLTWRPVIRWLILGVAFTLLAGYLEYLTTRTWTDAYLAAIAAP